MCLFGCTAKTTSMAGMYKHYIEAHTSEELCKWGINKEVLELGQTLEVLPEDYVKKQLNRYQAPKLRCEEFAYLRPHEHKKYNHENDDDIKLKEKLLVNPDPTGDYALKGSFYFRRQKHFRPSKNAAKINANTEQSEEPEEHMDVKVPLP